ncbi:MAG: carboxymuconolactone decarboxylase family protein [Candidatus Nitrohelix vancouverensis]|uniref:Carboxymuconolactone decarboxylase family protein n=1 Tax=Candidatus Nitrohelix vancouverensis TaxID=2705534 RepID=A0A7T0C1N5_9BACT|nr:MAG: carboxymuconolactone decarboxylase family protein [Candidatus Nitrohelix vancouverensis]
MNARVNYHKNSPEAVKALLKVESYLNTSSLKGKIFGLVKLRASQINGCAYCVNMHYGELKKEGVAEAVLALVAVWKDSPCFSERERAALDWAERVTLLAGSEISDEVYNRMREHFLEDELVDLTVAIGQINLWNRLSVSFKNQPTVSEAR